MKPLRIRAIMRKEFIHILRDPRSLLMAIAMPVILLILFGYALALDVDHVPLIIWDQSESPASRDFIARFALSRYFAIQATTQNYATIEHAIDTRKALGALIIPREFADDLQAGRNTAVQLLIDGTDSNTATIALGYADAVTRNYNQHILTDRIRRAGGKPPQIPIDIRPRVWFNEDLESRNFIIPGLIAVIMSVIAALLTSLTIAREWERGTMEQLISTPVTAPELIIGKLIPYFIIGMIDMIIAVLMAAFLFHVPMRGNEWLLFTLAAIFQIGALSQGITISIITRNQLMAGQIAVLSTFLPAFLLSGFAFAISNMPPILQYLTRIVPARYFVTLLKSIYLKGVGLEVLWIEAGLLSLFSLFIVTNAIKRFKKKLV